MQRFFSVIALVGIFVLVGCGSPAAKKIESIFPLPDTVENFDNSAGDEQVNFQTDMNVDEIEAFYRTRLSQQGLTERTLLTARAGDTLSFVFDGHESGKALVVQAVRLPSGATNVNIRLESL